MRADATATRAARARRFATEPGIDRMSPRRRPPGWPVLHQRWHRLLFLHWPFAIEEVRPLVPTGLELDCFDGCAWIGLTVFSVSRMRPVLFPPIPWLGSGDEINLRTYVHRDGVPGLWFLSLDMTNALAVWGARIAYRLPYYRARMDVEAKGDRMSFRATRTHPDAPAASFAAQWHVDSPLPEAKPGSLDFFLLERYVLFSGSDEHLLRGRIHHRPWPLRGATLGSLESTLLEAAGLPTPTGRPLLHAQALSFDVDVWPPARVA